MAEYSVPVGGPSHGKDIWQLRPETVLIEEGRPGREAGEPMNLPIFLASNFHSLKGGQLGGGAGHDDGGDGPRRYSRVHGTPSSAAFEATVGRLEGGSAVAFSSGMAAAAAVLELLPVGATVLLPRDCYMGVRHLLEEGHKLGRWQLETVDITRPQSLTGLLAGAALLWIETPSNPLLEICDLQALIDAAHAAGALVAVDNTFATPLLQQPLAVGADIVVHSATKFIGGHSDLLMGVAITGDPTRHEALVQRRALAGATPGGLECFLALRGIRTMAVRVAAAQASAGELARRLADHPAVTRVHYPGLPGHPGHELAREQMSGFGAVLSFELADAETADAACDAVRIIAFATSLGGVESTIERRAKHPGQEHVPAGLLRLSVGCEHIEDLWCDLTQAISHAE
ncbi:MULTISPECIES: trans-sulfuration enzyme family protein [unclassified Streptomyces]|uniref:trans-sulfuration enzyme family protein n=1 Tax=unclassified Streptomyces TaxID=2593676 RepID=UPI002E2F7463|nr:PLP-dependent aspartate aminotransferase family protein [Streptomyces sp. NBC_01361]